MTLKESALRVAAIDALERRIAEVKREARADLLAELLDLHDATGTKSVDVMLPDGSKVGGVTLTASAAGIVVCDRSAFDAWAAESGHAETVTTTRTDPAWEKATLGYAEHVEAKSVTSGEVVGSVVITPDGEEIPGVEYRPAGPPTNFSLKSLDREAIIGAYMRGELEAVVPTLALPDPKGEKCESE